MSNIVTEFGKKWTYIWWVIDTKIIHVYNSMFHACEMPQVWNGHACEILLYACEMLLHACYMEFYTWGAYLHATRNVVHANTRCEQYILVSCTRATFWSYNWTVLYVKLGISWECCMTSTSTVVNVWHANHLNLQHHRKFHSSVYQLGSHGRWLLWTSSVFTIPLGTHMEG